MLNKVLIPIAMLLINHGSGKAQDVNSNLPKYFPKTSQIHEVKQYLQTGDSTKPLTIIDTSGYFDTSAFLVNRRLIKLSRICPPNVVVGSWSNSPETKNMLILSHGVKGNDLYLGFFYPNSNCTFNVTIKNYLSNMPTYRVKPGGCF